MIWGSHPPLPRAEQTAAKESLLLLIVWNAFSNAFAAGLGTFACMGSCTGMAALLLGSPQWAVWTVRVGGKELAVLGVLMPALHFGALTGFIKTLGNSAFSRPPEACSQTGPWNVLQL